MIVIILIQNLVKFLNDIESIIESKLYYEKESLGNGKYIVEDPASGKLYVKKTLSVYNSDVYRFLQENPSEYIPKIFCFWEEEDSLVVIEEYIEGDTLETILSDKLVQDILHGNETFIYRKNILLNI